MLESGSVAVSYVIVKTETEPREVHMSESHDKPRFFPKLIVRTGLLRDFK